MKQILNNSIFKIVGVATLILGIAIVSGCEKFPLPETGSLTDETPPQAAFSSKSSSADYQTIEFANLSISAISYEWNFGDGSTSTSANPSHTYADGTYNVTLTAADQLGVTGTITQEVVVAPGPYQPFILEPGFEGSSARDPWRTETYASSKWAETFGITGSPVTFGNAGAKLEVSSARAGYQEIIVEANTVYDLKFWYTMKNDKADPWAIVSVLAVTENAPIDSKTKALASTIASITVNNTDDPSTYIEEKLTFDSGDNTTIAIYFYNDANIEARFDEFSIDLGTPGAVPPSAGFDIAQSETNYLEYSFTDGSTDAVSWEWDFGDGNTSTEQSPTHVYATHNIYDVTLTVKNAGNLAGSLTKTIDIQAPVTAAFSSMVDANDYQTYTFMDASEGAVMLLWEFGDGYQFTGMNPSHTYEADGTYTVTMTAYSVTGAMSVASEQLAITQSFVVPILNGTFDEFTKNTGDNADAWDMSPNSTVEDNNGNVIPSPYRPIWRNTALDSWLDGFYGDNSEQPGSSSGGNNGTRGGKLDEPSRRLYQYVQVQQGTSFKFSIDARISGPATQAAEVFILNTQIEDELAINASTSDAVVDAYYEIPNSDAYATYTFDFTPTTNNVVIYIRSTGVDKNLDPVPIESFFDNIKIEAN